jgi:hypothetical protein
MKTMRNITLATLVPLVATLLSQPPTARADNSAPVRLTFFKSFAGAGPAPYLFHFAGSFGGDFTGQLFTGVLSINSAAKIIHLVADYKLTADDGIHSFTAHVEGDENVQTKKAVLNGVVSAGAFEGAQVQVQFDDLGGGNFEGTIRIMPASAG